MIAAASLLADAAALGAGDVAPVPAGAILVKGAWSSIWGADDPPPELGIVSQTRYDNAYFGLSYTFGADWAQRYEGPPPSDNGYYVLAQLEPRDSALSARMGHSLIAAQDLFFSATGARSAEEFVDYYRSHLGDDYRVERGTRHLRLAAGDFVRLDYRSTASGLHWRILATEIRCHVVEFVFTSANVGSLERQASSVTKLVQQTSNAPTCIKNFADSDALLQREEPTFTEPRFNQVPVRVVVGRDGRIKQVHFLSAFPEQAKAVTEALSQWRFEPYRLNGVPVEVETGIIFGRSPRSSGSVPR
jgi:hypothetical protein